MTRRLNKQLVETIRANVIAATDLPTRREAIIAATKQAAAAWVASTMPRELREFAASRPKEWFHTVNLVPCDAEDNPLYLVRIEDMGWGKHSVPLNDPVAAAATFPSGMQLEFGMFAEYDACVIEARAWGAAYQRVTKGLSAMLASVRTVEALVARMPELTPHIPKSASPAYALVAPSNLLADLMRCGLKEPA